MRMTKLKQTLYNDTKTFWPLWIEQKILSTHFQTFFIGNGNGIAAAVIQNSLLYFITITNVVRCFCISSEIFFSFFLSLSLHSRFRQFSIENGSMNLRWKVPLVIFDKKFLVFLLSLCVSLFAYTFEPSVFFICVCMLADFFFPFLNILFHLCVVVVTFFDKLSTYRKHHYVADNFKCRYQRFK